MKKIVRFKEGDEVPSNANFLQGSMIDGGRVFFYEVSIIAKKKELISDESLEVIAKTAIDELNIITGKNFNYKTKENMKLIKGRALDGWRVADFIAVIQNMCAAWTDDPKMSQYLRPSTLFRASKFENYLNHKSTDQEAADAFAELEGYCE